MAKTIKQIANEIGVTKQAVYKRFKGKLNAACAPYAHTENGILYLDEQGEQIIKDDFVKAYCSNRDILERSDGAAIGAPLDKGENELKIHEKTDYLPDFDGGSDSGENELEHSKIGLERSNGAVEHSIGAPTAESIKAEYAAEIEFLRGQVDRLQTELEKEREHNREKDRQLLDTLAKLAETQAALAVGQSAEKQKALAETLIEGKQKYDEERSEPTETVCVDFKDAYQAQPTKRGLLRRLWGVITGNSNFRKY